MKDLSIQELLDKTTEVFNDALRIANEKHPKKYDKIAAAKRQVREILTDEIILEYIKSEAKYRKYIKSKVKK